MEYSIDVSDLISEFKQKRKYLILLFLNFMFWTYFVIFINSIVLSCIVMWISGYFLGRYFSDFIECIDSIEVKFIDMLQFGFRYEKSDYSSNLYDVYFHNLKVKKNLSLFDSIEYCLDNNNKVLKYFSQVLKDEINTQKRPKTLFSYILKNQNSVKIII